MKPTVCFITPPSPFLLDERVFPSLGILKVAAVAEQYGYQVEHLDLNGIENYIDAVVDHAARTKAMQFAITATTPQMPAATNIARSLRGCMPDCRIILGGPHPTVAVAAFRKELSRRVSDGRAKGLIHQMMRIFDTIVAGDGEMVIGPILESRSNFLIDADNPTSTPFMSSAQWAASPMPARYLIDMSSYHYTIDGKRVTSIISQLGCPFRCIFCAGRSSGMLRRIRRRPAADVLYEICHVVEEYGIEGFMFMDDELNVNNKEMLELMELIRKLQVNANFRMANRGFVKSELFTQEQADAMAAAGFKRVLCGFESGSARILKNIQKNATLEDNARMLKIAKAAGLEVKALMSIGHAGESAETVQQTVDWLLEHQPADFDCTIITPYPGCPYYDDAVPIQGGPSGAIWQYETNGDKLFMYEVDYSNVADYYKGAMEEYKSYVFTDKLSVDEIVALRDWAERTVRRDLDIPFYQAGSIHKIEHSFGTLPETVLRRTAKA